MKKELEARGFEVRIEHDFHLYNWEWRWDSLAQYDKFIVCFENHYFDPIGSPLLKDKEAYTSEILDTLKNAKLLVVEGTVYPLLSRLKAEGLLSSEWVEAEAGHPRKYYRLTAAGRRRVSEMARFWQSFSASLDDLLVAVRKEQR